MSLMYQIRQLFCTTPTSPVAKSRRTTLGLQRLEDRETPATFTVTSTADDGAGSLRDAVAQANTTAGADTIVFQAGLGPVTLTSDQLSLTDTTGATTISGPSGGTQVVLRSTALGTPLFRLFGINSGVTANLNHLTISNGRTVSGDGDGGGIRNVGNLTVSNSIISGNGGGVAATTNNGGGIYNGGVGTLTVTSSTISGNGNIIDVSTNGGGIYNSSASTVTVTNSIISGNKAVFTSGGGLGGGIFNGGAITVTNSTVADNSGVLGGGIQNAGTMTVTGSTITGNGSNSQGGSGAGGGISNGGILSLTNSTVSGNTATANDINGPGGGLFSNGTLTVTNSTFSGNAATGFGGGVRIAGGQATLTSVTIFGNRGDSNGGGETGGGLSRSGGTATVNNTIIAGNVRGTGSTGDDVSGTVASTSSNNLIGIWDNLVGISNGSQGNLIGTGAVPVNPLLQPLANNGGLTRTHALGQNSPALGKASTTVDGYSVYDQRGAARDNGIPDIGAYEVNHPLATVGAPTTLATLYAPKPSASANEAFVKGLYQSTLLRVPDAAGLAGWVSQLNGGTSRSTVANGFVNSIENRRNQVTFFYRYFLNREPDNAGLNGWVSILQGGTDEGQVMTGFILSNEFSGTNNNTQFVNLMYYALLSRQPDTAGFNGWVNALNAGQSRGTVVNALLRSEEGLNRVIDGLFQTYLKRYGSAGDLGAFRGYLVTNTFGQAATLMLASAEFFTNAGNNLS